MNYTVVLQGLKYINKIHKNLNINLQILFFGYWKGEQLSFS